MATRKVTMLASRIWQNYLMPSRLEMLADWFRLSLDRRYKFYSVEQYWRVTDAGRTEPPPKSIVLRHDIDVDLAAARDMFSLEKKLSITGSYYFRLSTVHLPLMHAIAGSGGEVGYHYEEVATEVKARCLRSAEQIRARLPMMRQRFRENLQRVREITGLPVTTVVAHGDWANRAVGVANTELLQCPDLRAELGVQVEAYDYQLMKSVRVRYADAACPVWWIGKHVAPAEGGRLEFFDDAPRTPAEAVRQDLPVIYILLHPEQWRSGPRWHFKEQVKRVREAMAYRLGIPMGSAGALAPHAGSLGQRSCRKPKPSPSL
jgi:hypothetical protein